MHLRCAEEVCSGCDIPDLWAGFSSSATRDIATLLLIASTVGWVMFGVFAVLLCTQSTTRPYVLKNDTPAQGTPSTPASEVVVSHEDAMFSQQNSTATAKPTLRFDAATLQNACRGAQVRRYYLATPCI